MMINDFCVYVQCVQDQSVPLALDVIVLRLRRDEEAVKLQLPCKFFLPFKEHQRNLKKIKQLKIPLNCLQSRVMDIECQSRRTRQIP